MDLASFQSAAENAMVVLKPYLPILAAKAVEKIGSEIPAGVKLPVKVELEDRTVELNKRLLKKDEKAPREALDKGLETDGYISGWSQPVRVTGYVRQCVGVDAQPVPGLSLSTER